jgi:prepilin-type N-terminal cleavage/methylation domain-containing protein
MQRISEKSNRGFSLIELVIVIVIIGILAAVAVPRLSRGAAGAADAALSSNLDVLRSAIDLYATEHGGSYPAFATVVNQLTLFSDSAGATSATKTGAFIYGPYLRKVPTLPVGPSGYKGTTTIIDGTSGTPGASAGAWFYNATTGEIVANLATAQVDASGKAYNTY